jgi:hypothetical protein
MVDDNMAIIYSWAEELGPAPPVPRSLKEPSSVAKFADFIDKNIFAHSEFSNFGASKIQNFLGNIAGMTKGHLSDIKDDNQRTNITLRIWASCLSAAKTMRKTHVVGNPDGSLHEEPYTPQMRETTFQEIIEPLAQKDEIYRIGVEAAPLFIKEVRRQKIFTEGVPVNSVVMKHMSI